MSILNIKIYGEEILRKKAEPVKEINKKVVNLINDMVETMYKARGVGLAAPQVGVSKRIIVIDTADEENKGENLIVLINPVIVKKEGQIEEEEGCLSVPGINASVKRFAEVTVTGFNIKGKSVKITATSLLSRVIQHEIDHLNGILFVDYLSFTQKFLLQKKIKELEKRIS